jgi:integrase
MSEKRKDNKGRILKPGEYYDTKNKRYQFRKMVNGKRVTISATNIVSLREQENELLVQIDKGMFLNRNSNMTLNEYFDFWLDNFAKGGRKATTCTNYQSYFNTYIRDGIGQKPIAKVSKLDCQMVINEMSEKGLKHSTFANLKSCLNRVFGCAIDDDIIFKNPIRNVQLPQTDSKKRESIDEETILKFLNFIKNDLRYAYVYPAFVVLFNTGMRMGELNALTWNDIDFDENTITVNKSLNRYRKNVHGFTMAVASPKSRTSVRTISMNSTVRSILLRHQIQSKHCMVKLPYLDDSGNVRGEVTDFVFSNNIGNPWNEPSFRCMITRIVNAYNAENPNEPIKDFCPHQIRHTFSSIAYCAGVDPLETSRILGHGSPTVTMNTYTHLDAAKKKEAEAAIASIKIS